MNAHSALTPFPHGVIEQFGATHQTIPARRAARCAAALVIRAALRGYNRLSIRGREHLPRGRSFVIVANHASHLDTPCLQAALPLRHLRRAYPVAAADYFFNGSLPRGAAAALVFNALPFSRGGGACHVRESLALCRDLLEDRAAGNVLIVYPEGTRTTSGAVGPFKRGIGDLVAGRDVPVVPCFIEGAFRAWPKGAHLPRPRRVTLTIGPPRTYAHVERSKQSAQMIADDLRRAVIAVGSSSAASSDAPEAAPYANLMFLRTLDQRNLFAFAQKDGDRTG